MYRVLVAVDESEERLSNQLDALEAFPGQDELSVTVLHVHEEIDVPADEAGRSVIDSVNENIESFQGVPDTVREAADRLADLGVETSVLTDQTVSWVLSGQWAFGPDVPAEATHEVARLSGEHWETIQEADPTALDHSGVESMTEAVMPELEIHPGVANFWEENDAWNDEWRRGETNE